MSDVAISFERVGIALAGRQILSEVSFDIRRGERTALVGPNGGGKTTLVKVLLGLLAPDSGRIVFRDESGAEVPRPRIGYLPQRSTLSADAPVSGIDLIALTLEPHAGFSRSRLAQDEARRALARAGLDEERAIRPVGRLSGGQRQRVLLARALAGSPSVLLLDEPDTALDAEGLKSLRRIVTEEVAQDRTVVYVTHDSDAMGGADAVFKIDGSVSEEPLA
jgi:ABC-type Mn2+/Zn2+ transport system ATPase subunit